MQPQQYIPVLSHIEQFHNQPTTFNTMISANLRMPASYLYWQMHYAITNIDNFNVLATAAMH